MLSACIKYKLFRRQIQRPTNTCFLRKQLCHHPIFSASFMADLSPTTLCLFNSQRSGCVKVTTFLGCPNGFPRKRTMISWMQPRWPLACSYLGVTHFSEHWMLLLWWRGQLSSSQHTFIACCSRSVLLRLFCLSSTKVVERRRPRPTICKTIGHFRGPRTVWGWTHPNHVLLSCSLRCFSSHPDRVSL